MNYFLDFVKELGAACLVFAALVGGIVTLAVLAQSWQCDGYQAATGKQTKYVRAECYINDAGAWYSWAEYKNRLVAKGQMAK